MPERPQSITIERRVRPLRFALLVDPTDSAAVAFAIGLNTTQWGGVFNAIVPAFDRRPRWWTELAIRQPTASEIVDAYLAAFDPDAVIAVSPQAARYIGDKYQRAEVD